VVLVLQGGGALGAYQVGVYEALHEAGIEPDWVIGTSIGAINGAIIAGTKPADRVPRLRELWRRFEQQPQFQAWQYFSTVVGGIPGFFSPRLPAWGGVQAKVGLDAASYYDTTPLRETLSSLIDLAVLNAAHPRLTVGAVNVKSGELRYFDSRDGASRLPRDPRRRRSLLGRRPLLQHAARSGARRQPAARLGDLRRERLAAHRPRARVALAGDGPAEGHPLREPR
jgi:predicted acylesterase/phospholipase RssA